MLTEDNRDIRRRYEGIAFLILFALTIPAANWLIGNIGTKCVPNGPCLIPVAPGLMAPSGVTMIGIALVLRDLVQRRLGVGVSVAAILAGAGLSALVAPPRWCWHRPPRSFCPNWRTSRSIHRWRAAG
jgi:hypothetical protein